MPCAGCPPTPWLPGGTRLSYYVSAQPTLRHTHSYLCIPQPHVPRHNHTSHTAATHMRFHSTSLRTHAHTHSHEHSCPFAQTRIRAQVHTHLHPCHCICSTMHTCMHAIVTCTHAIVTCMQANVIMHIRIRHLCACHRPCPYAQPWHRCETSPWRHLTHRVLLAGIATPLPSPRGLPRAV